MPVSALLVSHNGARWLPAVLAGVEQQTHPPDRGRDGHRLRDESVGILRRTGAWDVHRVADSPRTARWSAPVSTGSPPATARAGLGLAAARRLRPRPRRAGAAARPRRGETPRSRSSGPSCASGPRCAGCSRSASRSPAPGAARPGSSAASTTRASTTSAGRARGQHRRDAGPPRRARAARLRPGAAGLRQRHRLRLARRPRRPLDVVVPEAVVFHAEAAHRGRATAARGHHQRQARRQRSAPCWPTAPAAAAVPVAAARARH